MRWDEIVASTYSASDVAGTLTLRGPAAGATARTYSNCARSNKVIRAFDGGVLRAATVEVIHVPGGRGSSAQAPDKGEHATFAGSDVGTVRAVAEEVGYWRVEVGV